MSVFMRMCSTFFFAGFALHLDQQSLGERSGAERSGCPQDLNMDMWGIWIDGRDAYKGEDAYGKCYHTKIMHAFQDAYAKAQTGGIVDDNIFRGMTAELKLQRRNFPNPSRGETKACHQVLPPTLRKDIMKTVTVLDEKDHWNDESKEDQKAADDQVTRLFRSYSQEVNTNPGNRTHVLLALARLLQNMAFLHPFKNHNGRSRLVLLNYALRQQGIACGTMMYNNNKNILFSTLEEMVQVIEEGIDMYNIARASNFTENPWQKQTTVDAHFGRLPEPPWADRLVKCWENKTTAWSAGTSPLMLMQMEDDC